MEKISHEFDGYPTGLEEFVAGKLGIITHEQSVDCGVWEQRECVVEYNGVSSYSHCEKHSEKVAELTYKWKQWGGDHKVNERTEIFYRTPRVLIAKNEGGYASTGVCLDCVEEFLKKGVS